MTDYPGKIAAVLFCQGCPWSCAYCHNPHLTRLDAAPERGWDSALDFLRRRVGLLDAVVFSGGEPTAQTGLADAIRDVRRLGFQVGLHTSGSYPERLAKILPLVDWVGLDVKAPFEHYEQITGVPRSGAQVRESLRLLIASGKDHECRTTCHPTLITAPRLAVLSQSLFAMGARRHVLQVFRTSGCCNEALNAADAGAIDSLIDQAIALSPRAQRRG